jgi:hypothetical protein
MRLILLVKGFGGIFWADYPSLRRDLFHLLKVVASGSKQHNYYLINK